MKKREFLAKLQRAVIAVPGREARDRINFYSEMIDDRMEEGLSEEEAVRAIGSVEEIASQINEEFKTVKVPVAEQRSKKLKGWEIAVIILGSPLWAPLLIAAVAIVFSIYAVLWSLVIVLWAVELPFLIFYFISKYFIIVCKKATLGSVFLTKWALGLFRRVFGGGLR